MLYLKLDLGTPGRVIWVPFFTYLLFKGPSLKFDMAVKALTDDEKMELKEQFTVLDKAESG